MFTIVRLAINVAVRRMLTLVVVVFFIAWMVLFAQVFWTCEAERGWKTQPRPQCNLGRNVAIAQIISKSPRKKVSNGELSDSFSLLQPTCSATLS
jgi:hypothetical protein